MKKTLAIILALALVLCMMPSAAFAAGEASLTADKISFNKNASELYSGSNTLPTVSLTGETVQDSFSVAWKKDGQNVLQDAQNLGAGTYTAVVTTTGNGTYAAGTVMKDFEVVAIDPNKVTVTYSGSTEKSSFTGFESAKVGDNITISSLSDSTTVKQGTEDVESSFYNLSARKQSATEIRVYANFTGSGSNVLNGSSFVDFNVTTTLSNATYHIIGTGTDGAIPQQEYNGGTALTPTVYVVPVGETTTTHALRAGTDYTLSYSNNTQGNKVATVTAKGINGYSGEISATFDIKGKDINKVSITPQNTIQGVKPLFEIKDGNVTLAEGTDYTVISWDSNTAGTNKGTAVIKGSGNYSKTKTVYYTVMSAANTFEQSNVTYTRTYTPTYNGSYQYADITVKIGNNVLRKDYDYKVEYTYTDRNGKRVVTNNPKDTGYYSFTVIGTGNYAGTAIGYFEIKPVPLDWAEIILSSSTTTSGSYTVPKVSVRHISGGFYFLETDYTVSYRYLGSTSTYLKPTVIITPTANGNLTTVGSTKQTLEKEITYSARSISNCTVNFTDYRSSKVYDGTLTKPTVVVRDYSQNKTLTLNLDYTVTYKDAAGKTVTGFRDAGTYTVEIKGAGAYSGTTTLTYTITGTDISRYTVTLNTTSVNATGTAQRPTIVSVKYGTTSTLSSADYEVSYQDSTGKTVTSMITPGMYKVVVSGKNGYSGSTSASFRIVGTPQQISIPKTAYKVYKDSESFRITATATGDGTGFSYVSSDPSVATVSDAGVVTIHKIGRAKITVTTTGMKKSDPVFDDVYVKVYPDKEKITQKPFTEGKTKSFRVRWDKQDDVTYYEVRYARNSSFRSGTYTTKKVNASTLNYDTQSTQIKTSYSKAKYYVKVRAVKVVYNDYGQELKYYGTWSNWRSVVTR